MLRASTSPPVVLTVAEGGAGAKTAREGSLASAKADALAAGAAAGAGATVNVRAHKKAILVEGETKKINDLLRALEGSWNRKLGGWVFQGGKRDEATAAAGIYIRGGGIAATPRRGYIPLRRRRRGGDIRVEANPRTRRGGDVG